MIKLINDRIKLIRESVRLSQSEFAEKLNLKRNSISLMEGGKRNPSNRTINDICKVFNVSEEWLRTGEGSMISNDVSSTMQQLKKEYDLNSFDYELIAQYLQLTTDQRKTVCDYFRNVILASDNADSIANSVPDEPPADMDDIDSFTEHRKAAE